MSEDTNDAGSSAHELCRATNMWPTKEDDSDDFVKSLIKSVNRLTEDEYNAIPVPAQSWYEQAVEAENNSLPYPDLDGFDDVVAMNGAEKPTPRVTSAPAEVDPKTAAKKKRAAKKAEKQGKPEPAEKKQRQLTGAGKVSAIAKIMLDNPAATVEDIRNGLKKLGLNAAESVVPTFRSAFRNLLSMGKRENKLTKELASKIDY